MISVSMCTSPDGSPASPASLRGQRVTVMGLGRFGGGVGAVNFLLRQGACVTLTDQLSAEELQSSLARIDVTALDKLVLGEHRDEDFTQTDLLIVNPAVKPGNRYVELAEKAGAKLSSELNLFWQFQRGRIAAVTGTVGKSTTAALLAHVLNESGINVRLGGNIGISLLDQLEQLGPEDWTVLEVSSFQLHRLASLRPCPDIALVTNVYPNHLDWHGSFEHYRESKQHLLRWLTPEKFVACPADSEIVNWPTAGTRIHVTADGLVGVPRFAQLPGPHNRRNLALVHAVAKQCFRLSTEAIINASRTFTPLPHRLEFVGEISGRRCYNDSKATTPEAAVEALRSFDRPIRLVAGGADKGVDLTPFADAIARHAASVSLIGTTAEKLSSLLRSLTPTVSVTVCANLAAAVHAQWEQSQPGDILLLSPGCASFGEFRNYEERGEAYCALVEALRCRATS